MKIKEYSPYAFRSSDRVRDRAEHLRIQNGIKSPLRDKNRGMTSTGKGSTRPMEDTVIPEDNACFITQTNYIFPNILHKTRDNLDLGRYKAAKSVEHYKGT